MAGFCIGPCQTQPAVVVPDPDGCIYRMLLFRCISLSAGYAVFTHSLPCLFAIVSFGDACALLSVVALFVSGLCLYRCRQYKIQSDVLGDDTGTAVDLSDLAGTGADFCGYIWLYPDQFVFLLRFYGLGNAAGSAGDAAADDDIHAS